MAEGLIGLDCYLYRNTGSYASPSWNLIDAAAEMEVTATAEAVDVSSRASNFKLFEQGQIELRIKAKIPIRDADADIIALYTAFFARTAIEFTALSGPQGTAGSRGPRFKGKIVNLSRTEPLNGAVTYDMEVVPVVNPDAVPAWYVTT